MSYSVLIVEDEPVLARNICVYLERQGLSCQIAESGEQGLALLDEHNMAVVPGEDFSQVMGYKHIRMSFACSEDQIREGVKRLTAWPGANPA